MQFKLEGISATRHVRVVKMNKSTTLVAQDSSDERYIYIICSYCPNVTLLTISKGKYVAIGNYHKLAVLSYNYEATNITYSTQLQIIKLVILWLHATV